MRQYIDFHKHGNKLHTTLSDHEHGAGCCSDNDLSSNDEGCPCCQNGIDLDEAVALAKLKGDSHHAHAEFETTDYSSPLSIVAAPFIGILGLIGVTAAYRNITGTYGNIKKLDNKISQIETKLTQERKISPPNIAIVQRLEAYKKTLEYSRFDAKFNFYVPGIMNGAASLAILISLAIVMPYALPLLLICNYAVMQTIRNGYDLSRSRKWQEQTETTDAIENQDKTVANAKINQISQSKRNFYAANAAGFAMFAVGALVAALSVLSVIGQAGLIAGAVILGVGAISTAITNNIWTNKFRPRNGDLGKDRTQLDLDNSKVDLANVKALKDILKNYKRDNIDKVPLKSTGYAIISAFPTLQNYGLRGKHKLNQKRINNHKDKEIKITALLREIYAIKGDIFGNTKCNVPENQQDKITEIKKLCDNLGISKNILSKIINDYSNFDKNNAETIKIILAKTKEKENLKNFLSTEEYNTIKRLEAEISDLKKGLIYENCLKLSEDNKKISLNIDAINKDQDLKTKFLNAVEDYLVFDYLKDLRYKQYGLNDYFWSLKGIREKYPINEEELASFDEQTTQEESEPNHQCKDPGCETTSSRSRSTHKRFNGKDTSTDFFSQFEGICQPTSDHTKEDLCRICNKTTDRCQGHREQQYKHIDETFISSGLYADTLQYKLQSKNDIIRIKSPENGFGCWEDKDIVKKTTENIQNALSKTEGISDKKLFVENVLKFAQQQQSVGNTAKGEADWNQFYARESISRPENGFTFKNAKSFSAAYQAISEKEGLYTGRGFEDNLRTDRQIGARLKRIPSALHQEIIRQIG
ncbi:hypothetical protein OAP83_01685 [Rickettsiales bacterium]|nr:hypothetical protein [Rickettsiales bacterium]